MVLLEDVDRGNDVRIPSGTPCSSWGRWRAVAPLEKSWGPLHKLMAGWVANQRRILDMPRPQR
jgi:hypothetical protein